MKAKANLIPDKKKVYKKIGYLLLIYTDDNLSDSLTLGDTRKKAFKILPKESIRSVGEKMIKKPQRKMENQWKERENAAARYKCHLRSLCANIEFSSLLPNNPDRTSVV